MTPKRGQIWWINLDPTVAVVDQIRAVDKRRFVRAKGFLNTDDLEALEQAIGRVLDLPC